VIVLLVAFPVTVVAPPPMKLTTSSAPKVTESAFTFWFVSVTDGALIVIFLFVVSAVTETAPLPIILTASLAPKAVPLPLIV